MIFVVHFVSSQISKLLNKTKTQKNHSAKTKRALFNRTTKSAAPKGSKSQKRKTEEQRSFREDEDEQDGSIKKLAKDFEQSDQHIYY